MSSPAAVGPQLLIWQACLTQQAHLFCS